ncbi:hypothetical protein JCM19233_5660 [Vibrio astriarenae]|nr:hypothetical protein JCM19233_5660 [Vibrio sp. C7]
MSSTQYRDELDTLVTHALLHLLCQVAHSSRFVPSHKRDEILVKFIKPKVSDKAYRAIKSELKTMVSIGKKKGGQLERKLYKLQTLSAQSKASINAMEGLYKLLSFLEKAKA